MGPKLLENFGVLIVTISIKILDILKRPQKFDSKKSWKKKSFKSCVPGGPSFFNFQPFY